VKIAVILEQDEIAGGGFVHQLSIARLVNQRGTGFESCFYATERAWLGLLQKEGIAATYLATPRIRRWLSLPRRNIYLYRGLRRISKFNWFERRLLDDGVDLVLFPGPSQLALDCEYLNYIVTVWDLCHRDFPEFPEVRAARKFEEREAFYASALPKAVAVIADSEVGRRNIMRRYGVDEERIRVAPFLVPDLSGTHEVSERELRGKYAISGPFLFYPAQFWPHKNHAYILRALHRLREDAGLRIGAVFCGADKGNLKTVRRIAERLGLANQIEILGFVPKEDLIALYRAATALVMPTYFGPTNLPPLEAFKLGVPVIYPDLPGLREQVSGAALLVDLGDPGSLARALEDLLQGRTDRDALIRAGRAKVSNDAEGAYWGVLDVVFREFQTRLDCWKEG
jgi:glycosyltransferase involved in cell wall biosynthesis